MPNKKRKSKNIVPDDDEHFIKADNDAVLNKMLQNSEVDAIEKIWTVRHFAVN